MLSNAPLNLTQNQPKLTASFFATQYHRHSSIPLFIALPTLFPPLSSLIASFCPPYMVKPRGTLNSVWCLEQFSLPNDKLLEVTVYERNGGRHLSFTVDADDLLLTSDIERLRLKW